MNFAKALFEKKVKTSINRDAEQALALWNEQGTLGFLWGRSSKKFPLHKCFIPDLFIPEICVSDYYVWGPGMKTDFSGLFA